MGARKNAFTLLVEMGHAFLRFGSSQEGEAGMRAGRTDCLQAASRVIKPPALGQRWRECLTLFLLWLRADCAVGYSCAVGL